MPLYKWVGTYTDFFHSTAIDRNSNTRHLFLQQAVVNSNHNIWIKLFHKDAIAAIIMLASGDLFLFWLKKAYQIEMALTLHTGPGTSQAISKQEPIWKGKGGQIGGGVPASMQANKKLNEKED